MRKIIDGSDILVETTFKDVEGNPLPIPDYDFEFTYFVTPNRVMKAGKQGTEFVNCYPNGEKIIVVLDNPSFGIGQLKCRKVYDIPDDRFTDGFRREVEISIIAKIC